MADKIKITFVVQESLQQELKQQVISDGYGMRGKSRWITEAIERLLQLEDYPSLVHLSNEMKGFPKTETIMVTREVKQLLDQAIHTIRTQHPLFEGVQSSIIRTSILQRLLRS